ncbi:MAG: nuclear transport factor 2 family protein [Burkholderiales bacterium]
MKYRIKLLAASVALLAGTAHAATPKDVVTAFAELAFAQGQAVAAAKQYISPDKYVQHNPQAADGREAFIKGFGAYVESSGPRCAVKRVIAEGELVVLHSHCKEHPKNTKERGSSVVDIFRVENGLIVEHWDVEQAVPAKAANKNTMF